MEIKLKANIDLKTFRQAAVMFDLDIPSDDEIKEMCDKEVDLINLLGDDEAHKMRLGLACGIMGEFLSKEKKSSKSKFQQRLEEAQKRQEQTND